jgi:HD-GYP domain-containing protein (c-di-GMP phosphodiesterase class II)
VTTLREKFTGSRSRSCRDTFGAVTADSPYRKAISVRSAVEELNRHAGACFDRNVVGHCVRNVHEAGIHGMEGCK